MINSDSGKVYLVIFLIIFMAGTIWAAKPAPKAVKLTNIEPQLMQPGSVSPRLGASDTCSVYMGGDPAYYIYPWVIGDELYKAYQDPAQTCDGPYPFSVEAIHFLVVYMVTDSIYVSVDVEDADLSNPSCPVPGNLLAISSTYQVNLDNGFYLVSIPLDSPIVVNGPFFAGLYFADAGNPSAAAMVIDSFPAPCVSYNNWGEGFVDLDTVQTDPGDGSPLIKTFPGRLLLFSSGTTGGSGGTQPEPAAIFINPPGNRFLGEAVDLWAAETAGSEIIRDAQFQYLDGGLWTDIGVDELNDPPLRNGVTASGFGDGLSYAWNTIGLMEDDYQIRVIVTDSLGRADTAVVPSHIDPTPPTPVIQQPALGQNVCDNTAVVISCSDEDISFISFEKKGLPKDFTLPIPIINQNLGGDINGLPLDGNLASNGEFGDYCSGPAAVAMACKYWYDKGYSYIMKEGASILTDAQLMDRLFEVMRIQEYLGAYDGIMISGMRDYIVAHGSQFQLKTDRTPTAATLFSWVGEYEYPVMVGISGNPGLWLTVTGTLDFSDPSGHYQFKVIDPTTGTIEQMAVQEQSGRLWLHYNLIWREIDLLLAMVPYDWTVTRAAVGFDSYGGDGWGFTWDTETLSEDSLYFICALVSDLGGHEGIASALVGRDCLIDDIPGDVDASGLVNPADIVYLTNFYFLGGPPPPGGMAAADINCDGRIDTSDVIYLYRYLFLGGPDPCP